MFSISNNASSGIIKKAHREGNLKRREVLVNSAQAKHVPTNPRSFFEMVDLLIPLVAEKIAGTPLVIGFAETATAIGAAVAARLCPGCFYIHSTRESLFPHDLAVRFLEEHSHAVHQRISLSLLDDRLNNADTIIFVDDEITTGRTILNAIAAIDGTEQRLRDKHIVVASVVNRLHEEDLNNPQFKEIRFCSIYGDNGWHSLRSITFSKPSKISEKSNNTELLTYADTFVDLGNPRIGVNAGAYEAGCIDLGRLLADEYADAIESCNTIAIIGTEECMYPAIVCGKVISDRYPTKSVKCHATTRSPISVSGDPDYPINNGVTLRSPYDFERTTYIYNMSTYDLVVIVTDAHSDHEQRGLRDLFCAFEDFGAGRIAVVRI